MSKPDMENTYQPPYSDAPPAYGFNAPQGPQPMDQHHMGQPPPQQVILVTEQPRTMIITSTQMAGLGPNSLHTNCPSCRQPINTRLQHEISSRAHLFALLLCLFGCWPCVCIPYCMDSCKNTNHFCPNCNAFMGTFQA